MPNFCRKVDAASKSNIHPMMKHTASSIPSNMMSKLEGTTKWASTFLAAASFRIFWVVNTISRISHPTTPRWQTANKSAISIQPNQLYPTASEAPSVHSTFTEKRPSKKKSWKISLPAESILNILSSKSEKLNYIMSSATLSPASFLR